MKVKVINVTKKEGTSKATGNHWVRHEVKVMEVCESQKQRAMWFKFTITDQEQQQLNLSAGDFITGEIFLNLRRWNNVDGSEHEDNEVTFLDIKVVNPFDDDSVKPF